MSARRRPGRTAGRLGKIMRVLPVLTAAVLAFPSASPAREFIHGEIVIEATAVRPEVLMTEPEHAVIFINRSGRGIHLDLVIRDPELHHVVEIPDRMWAVFHRPGRHPYVVHFQDPTAPDLRGVIEVVSDPYGGPDARICSGVTVMGACIER